MFPVTTESPRIPGDREECSGTESGWTTYIVSPIHEYDGFYDDAGDCNNHRICKEGYEDGKDGYRDAADCNDNDDDESNDSMASDASSGPIHHELPCESSEGGNNHNHFNHADGTDHSKFSTCKKEYKQTKHERRITVKVVAEEKLKIKANSAASHAGLGITKWNLKNNDQ